LSETFHKCWEGRGGDLTTPDTQIRGSCRGAVFVVGVAAPRELFERLVLLPAGGTTCLGAQAGDSGECNADEALVGSRKLLFELLGSDLVGVAQENQVEAFVRRIANVIPLLPEHDV
jgi:hypothetical protein